MKKYQYHLLVIGAGSAGLSAAGAAIHLGARVALIEKDKMGGECLNTGCVPSKSLLRVGHLARDIRKSHDYGISTSSLTFDMKKIKNYVKTTIKKIEAHDSVERFEKMGVDVYLGTAKFISAHEILVNGQTLTAKKIIIATGSKANIPAIKGLKDTPYLTHETIFDLEILPKTLAILGSGAMALELGQAFQSLGVNVHILMRGQSLLKKSHPRLGQILKDQLETEGMIFIQNVNISHIEYKDTFSLLLTNNHILKCDAFLIAAGKTPSTLGLNLEGIGVEINAKGFIECNRKLQTTQKNIYVSGDIVGPYLFTHMANYQATIAVQNALFPMRKKVSYDKVPYVIYTQPEIAHVGPEFSDDDIIQNKYDVFETDLLDNDRAITENSDPGFMKVITNKGVVIAGTIVAPNAGDLLPLLIVAIKNKYKLTKFLALTLPYPTQSEMIKDLAVKSLLKSTKPWQLKLLKNLFFK